MTTSHKVFLVAGMLVAGGFIATSCSDSSGNGNGNPGQAGSTGAGGGNAGTTGNAGSGGSGGGSGGMAGGTPGFMAIAPCLNESDYVTTGTTINFPVSATDFNYAPKCLKVTFARGVQGTAGAPGTNVTFSGDFSMHPLMPSALRGDVTGNPITATSAGTSKSFYVSSFGTNFYAYYCAVHNPSDNGAGMSGVIWAVAE
jgi:plastocyanin